MAGVSGLISDYWDNLSDYLFRPKQNTKLRELKFFDRPKDKIEG